MAFCKNKNNKLKLFKFALLKNLKYIDFINIIKSLQQLDKIKKIVLNNTQFQLFKNYGKPIFDENNFDKSDVFEGREDYYSLYEKYQKAKSLSDTNKIYKRVLLNLDPELKKIFDSLNESIIE